MNIKHHWGDGQYAKEIQLEQGEMVGKHLHAYTHLSILALGRVELKRWGTDKHGLKWHLKTIVCAGECVTVEANVLHQITALEDSIWYCTHATDETDPEKVDQVTIMKGRT